MMAVEACDTCGELVGEGRPDADWSVHNSRHYVEHVFISHSHEDAMRIVQQHLDALDADIKALREAFVD